MAKCAFFGHRNYSYAPFREKIESCICDLIKNHGVTEFLNGFRGDFDNICARAVFSMKKHYPNIKNIMVMSYHPQENFSLPQYFDESVYLLERSVMPKFAVFYTNQAIVQQADFIVSGVVHDWGGAWTACNYARKQKKIILSVVDYAYPSCETS